MVDLSNLTEQEKKAVLEILQEYSLNGNSTKLNTILSTD